MFERRLRLFLLIVFLGGLLLVARAAQVQIVDGDDWLAVASSNAERVSYLDAPRGDLLDNRNRIIARDVPTFEACVNYRAIPSNPNPKWLRTEAIRRARKDAGWSGADTDARELLISRESQGVLNDLDEMWTLLGQLANKKPKEIDDARAAIVDGVEKRQRRYWQSEFQKAMDEFHNSPSLPWYERWIAGARVEPKTSDYENKTIADQFVFHALLPDISQDVYNRLKLAQDRFPQFVGVGQSLQSVLDVRPAVRRDYPYRDVAAQTIGRVRAVSATDRTDDPTPDDELRRYGLVDRIGGEGLEALLESQLRGSRGEQRTNRRGEHLSVREPTKGQAVRTSLDIELCAAIQDAFREVEFHNPKVDGIEPKPEFISMNGAAIVIDVKTGEVRALVSVPSYDLNQFNQLFESLAEDDLNRPMINRALMDAMEPGSTVKPIVGLAAVTQKLIKVTDTVECDGYAHINGKRVERPRCWTMSMFNLGHHQTAGSPHATGFLTLSEAIERSCNVYFVTQGSKMGLEGLSFWMKKFGFGQPTRIGLPESRGIVPTMSKIPPDERASSTWYASIGQGPVLATPIQIANEMATIARDGIWLRPTLLKDQSPRPTTQPDGSVLPDRIDLKLDPDAVKAVQKGMIAVVNSPAGTGKHVHRDDVLVAAKTGSATAAQLTRIVRDAHGEPVRDSDGHIVRDLVPYGSHDAPNLTLPWYRLTGYEENGKPKGAHSWVGGFVPADKPVLAFAVYVEYGGSGGVGAASVVRRLIDKCIELNYIDVDPAHEAPPPTTHDAELIVPTEN